MRDLKPEKESSESFGLMLDLIKQLRSETGCPWDRKQTMESFHPYILEEYHELVHAISQNDPEAIIDEAGDLIFLTTFIAYMIEQHGYGTVKGVLDGVVAKMTLRHPHVFGDVKVNGSQEVIENWAKIKASEKLIKDRNSILDGIPRSAPALTRAQKMTSRAAKVGFDWPDIQGVMDKINEELVELKRSMETQDETDIKAEFGDVLLSLVNLGRRLSVNCESALVAASDRFEERFHHVEQQVRSSGRSLEEASLEEMDSFWNEAKTL